MELPKHAADVAANFDGLSTERKQQLIAHLAQTPQERAQETVRVMIANGGPESAFVAALFGPAPARKPIRDNVAAKPETQSPE